MLAEREDSARHSTDFAGVAKMANAHLDPLANGRLIVTTGLAKLFDLTEDKGVRDRRTGDHHAISTRLPERPLGILGSLHIAIEKYRDRDDPLDLRNPVPVRHTRMPLRPSSAMDRQRLSTSLLQHRSDIEDIDRIVVPAKPRLHGNGQLDGVHGRPDHPLHSRRALE